jgi:hypothetical protein
MNKLMSLVIIFVSLSISTNLVLAQANLSKDTSQDTIAQKAYLEPLVLRITNFLEFKFFLKVWKHQFILSRGILKNI